MNEKYTKIHLLLNFIKCLPRIGFRFLNLLFRNKKVVCKVYKVGDSYCFEGALNQLIWEVENAVFITLSNSSKIFFNSGEILFQVNSAQTEFQLSAFGAVHKLKHHAQIKVANFKKNEFEKVMVRATNVILECDTVIDFPNYKLQHNTPQSISFLKFSKPKSNKEIKMNFPLINYLDQYSITLFNTQSIEEVRLLKQQIDKNL